MAAQNKIGSNFDISTAVYGSHLYKNVLPRQAFEVVSSKDFSALLKID
jgi:phosphomevalonate kinase